DISDTVTSLDPTQIAPSAAWNRIVRPANDTSTYRSDNFVVFTLPLPGNAIDPSSIGKNPILRFLAGFQVSLEYQSPTDNTRWYPYSFLQGNNATNTWISSDPSNPSNLSLATSF